MSNLEVRAMNAPWRSGIEFLVKIGNSIGTNITIETPLDGISYPPTFSLSIESAQVLMDDLWNCGLRPTEGTGSAGSLAATERHLNDMRNLVSKILKVNF